MERKEGTLAGFSQRQPLSPRASPRDPVLRVRRPPPSQHVRSSVRLVHYYFARFWGML